MNNEDYIKELGLMYEEVMSLRKDEDYVVNQPQMDNLVKVLAFFMEMAKRLGGEVEPLEFSPKEERGDVVARFVVFHVYGEDVQRFADIIKLCSVVGMDANTDDEVCISCTIPDVFVRKEFLMPEGDGVKN